MFLVTDADANAIRTIFEKEGEFLPPLSCAGGFQGSTTTPKPEHARGRLPGYDNGLWPSRAGEFWPSFRSMIAWHGPWARTAC
jgi:hypothetical protein